MPSSIGHALAGYAVGTIAVSDKAGRRFGIACAGAAVVPDLDVLMSLLPVQIYTALGGHRGITHSLSFAAVFAAGIVMLGFSRTSGFHVRFWLALALAIASHPLLDMLTSYGSGVALWAPFNWAFVEFPWHPIDPGTASRGARTMLSKLALGMGNEVLWVWLPASAMVGAKLLRRRIRDQVNASAA